MPSSSRVFLQNRALGYVSNGVPLVVRYITRRKEHLIVTCTGKSFHTYGCSHFSLLSVCSDHPAEITCLGADRFLVYTSAGGVVYAWRRGAELSHVYKHPGTRHPVHSLLPFGAHLISVDQSSTVRVWDVKAESLYLELQFDNASFEISTVCHPDTYINKVLLGSRQGTMQLWNIRTSKLVYSFAGWGSAVTVLTQAPAVDVVGVGLANGKIILHNLRYDESVMEFIQDWGPVTCLSFRTDGHPIMASGSECGHVVFWNLEEKKVSSQLLHAHSGAVAGMQCLPSEPLMVTSSPDNSLKLWIFDLPDGGARLLRIREGHIAPPSRIRFHGNNGDNILSAGGDSTLRIFSTKTETFNKNMGLALFRKKSGHVKRSVKMSKRMPPIVNFTSETTREKEWDSIAATHCGLPVVTTWSYDRVKMGDLKLFPDRLKKKSPQDTSKLTATCLCMTHCGNFVIVGYSSGHVDRFNMQSGIHRASYGLPSAHEAAVRGVAADGLNQIVISGGSDGLIKFWHFKDSGRNPLSVLSVGENVTFFHAHHESAMLAVALDDFTLSIVDVDSQNIVRKFVGHTAQLTDAAFSPDSRWLVTSAMDCFICVWDIPSATLVDCFTVEVACTSLSFSPTGEYLATAHVDLLGIYLWSNRTLYTHVSLRPLSDNANAVMVELPGSSADIIQTSSFVIDDLVEDEKEPEVVSPDQLAEDLITLSLVANSRWQNLLNIDIVKKRNKPKEVLKTPKAAPFFLPTVPTLRDFDFDLSGVKISDGENSKVIDLSTIENLSAFGKALSNCSTDYSSAFTRLKEMGPSAIDIEINSLAPEGGGSMDLMVKFLGMIDNALNSNADFELAQAYLGLFLKVHGDTISLEPKLYSVLDTLIVSQLKGWDSLKNKLQYNLCVVKTLKEA